MYILIVCIDEEFSEVDGRKRRLVVYAGAASLGNHIVTNNPILQLSNNAQKSSEVALLQQRQSLDKSKLHIIRSSSSFKQSFNVINDQHSKYCRAFKIELRERMSAHLAAHHQWPHQRVADVISDLDRRMMKRTLIAWMRI
jgi:hypothetical protein